MRDGAERDADVARERSRVGAGSAYRDESKHVGAVRIEGEIEVFNFDAADGGRFNVLAAAREPIERNAGALDRGVHRRDLVDHASISRLDFGNFFSRYRGHLSAPDDGAVAIQSVRLGA